jgi:osmoprotectant transport system permease protein
MWGTLAADTARHALLALLALGIACGIGAPLGLLAAARGWARTPVLALAALGRTLPSIAVLALLVPFLGVGIAPALAALTLLALPPIVINVDIALRSVPAAQVDVATALGFSPRGRFFRVVVPLALPVAIAGVRTAGIEVIGSATLATFVGAGGLGDDIVRALQTGDTPLLAIACVLVALLAFAFEVRG